MNAGRLIGNVFRHIFLTLCLLCLLPDLAVAQMLLSQRTRDVEANIFYNESVYILSNYSSPTSVETRSLEELLQTNVEGFYFYIRKDTISNALMLRNPDGRYSPFIEALTTIKQALREDSRKILTLFLDYVIEADMVQAFSEIGLMDYVCEYDIRTGWPSLKNMLSTDRRLVLFEVQHHLSSPSWLHNMQDYVEHTDVDWGGQRGVVETFDERQKKTLSLFTNLKYLEATRGESEINDMARYSPFIIEAFKREWIRDGLVPNFVLVNKYYPWLTGTLFTFRNFSILSGVVTSGGDVLNYVNWDGLSNHTSGRFTFPLEPGAEMTLIPVSPGYDIEPARYHVAAGSGKRIFAGEFKAKPLPANKNLELNLPLNGSVDDESHNNYQPTMKGVEFGLDPSRGEVAFFENGARIDLPLSSVLKMKDHDFTVGVWLKVPQYVEGKQDYCVLGSQNSSYQQALHLLIRNRKPYMGFFNNDIVGMTEIEPGKWYHVAWRYNKSNGEQAIFVNGKLDAISVDRPSYIGNDTLYVGYLDFSRTAGFIGNLSGLNIWSRVLSDKEIYALSNNQVDLNASSFSVDKGLLGGVMAILLFCSILAYRFYRKGQPVSRKGVSAVSANGDAPNACCCIKSRNIIHLFGEFCVIDKDGENITSMFTPKIKQLFLLILLHSSRGGQGVLTSELTENLWGSNAGKNIKSLRSVSILKLRKILEHLDKAEIIFSGNRYFLQISGDLSCDYLQYLDMLKEKGINTPEDFERFYQIVCRGGVFEHESYDWMDEYKSYVSNSSTDVMLRFIRTYSVQKEGNKVIQIAEQILMNDSCNVEALFYKVRALAVQGNLKQARYAYDKFCDSYQLVYAESFNYDFEQMISLKEGQISSTK